MSNPESNNPVNPSVVPCICGNCLFYVMRSNADGVCRRFPPTAYPAPGKNLIGETVINQVVLNPVVGYKNFCGEFIAHPDRMTPENQKEQTKLN